MYVWLDLKNVKEREPSGKKDRKDVRTILNQNRVKRKRREVISSCTMQSNVCFEREGLSISEHVPLRREVVEMGFWYIDKRRNASIWYPTPGMGAEKYKQYCRYIDLRLRNQTE